jgi:Arc/MetJ-type ribon-helix-helix transcriptional regulator
MATAKITVTIPEELSAYIREQVEAGKSRRCPAIST